MRLKCSSLAVLALCVVPVLSVRALADVTVTPIITLQEAQTDFSAGKYSECIRKIDKMLEQHPRPTPAEKANLLNMKAECLLQQKQATTAEEGFAAASTAYKADKKADDKKSAAVAAATGKLIEKSEDFIYTPKTYVDKNGKRKLLSQKPTSDKTPAPAPIGILDPATRPAAITALFEDQYTLEEPEFKELSGKFALPPLEDFAPKLEELCDLELAATGANAETGPMQTTFYNDTQKTLDSNLTQMQQKVDSIAASAATMVNEGGNGGGGKGKKKAQKKPKQKERGLSDDERTTLGDMVSELDKIPDAVKVIVPALAPGTDELKPELARAVALKKKIDSVLAGHFK